MLRDANAIDGVESGKRELGCVDIRRSKSVRYLDASEEAAMKVINTQKGPRGLNTKDGPVLVDPGQSVDVEMSETELAVAKKTGWFEFGAAAAKAAAAQDPLDHDSDGKKGGSLPKSKD